MFKAGEEIGQLPPRQLSQEPPRTAEMRKKIQNYSFLLSDRIGKGYSSVVYRGLNDLTGAEVAIKVIELKSLKDQTSKGMLQTEIECFKETRHPSLLHYENSFFTLNNCYIITEYCASGDLAKLIRQRGGFSQEEAGRLFLQIFQGYQHFHNAGFIHRDLKPANIFVTAGGALRIADFGFSKRRSIQQRDNYNVGTPIYMPRESLTSNIYNEKTDIWALGVTLYEMLFACVPFRGKTELELRQEIEKGVLVFPENKPISQDLKSFICSCLQAEAIRRPSLREMHSLPWLQRLLREEGEREEEKEMRISLPNEGMPHNKSKDYFDKPSLLENRRSISSMQKLKLCHPKKASQVTLPISLPRQPLVNRSLAAINITMPLHKKDDLSKERSVCKDRQDSENKENAGGKENLWNKENLPSNRAALSISTLPSQNIKSEISKQPTAVPLPEENRLKTGIEKIVSLINYFRLLYKIAERTGQALQEVLDGEIKAELTKLSVAVLGDLRRNFQMHQECLSSRSNVFCLNGQFWGQFVGSERWNMYGFVIKRYQLKYQNVLKSTQVGNVGSWRVHFLHFYQRMRQMENSKVLLVRQRYSLCELAYLLETLVEMNELVSERGWEDFTEKYSSTDEFIPEGFTISMANYYEVDECVRHRYTLLCKDKP